MLRRSILTIVLCLPGFAAAPAPKPRPVQKPKLVLGIVIDQFRYEYFARFRSEYTGGFARMYERGAVFTQAHLEHYPTVTGIGHATFMTGATPAMSGIVNNEWYDRETAKRVNCVQDDGVQLLGGKPGAKGFSPRRLLVTTVGDEMKLAWQGKPRVIGISSKDRGAILPSGHMADGAYWFDENTGNFVSSSFYFDSLPAWVQEFNAKRPADKYLTAEWTPLVPHPDWPAFSRKMSGAYSSLEESPFGNELVEQFAERAIEAEKLGQDDVTDLLSVSFSSNDYVGHDLGPHAPEVRDMSIRVDRTVGKLLDYLDKRVGLDNMIVVFTADHGVSPLPETMKQHRAPGGRLVSKEIHAVIETALSTRFGEGKWIVGSAGADPYFNHDLIASKKLDGAEVHRVAADAVRGMPHVFRVFTREQLANGWHQDDRISRRVSAGFYAPRAADLAIVETPFWIQAAKGATHGSPWLYDSHIPLVFMGPGVKPGIYHTAAAENDIAPTLAALLWIETPAGSVGRVLAEALGH
jgi:predicted AlkP superfamily pyrophosphatase or phosphodiesterase